MDTTDARIGALVQMISEYTQQIAQYEDQGVNYAMACIAFIGVVVGVIIGLLEAGKKNDKAALIKYKALSIITLLIPSIVVSALYTFSLNMRKSALYRAYLSYVEDTLNGILGTKDFLFDGPVVEDFLGHGFLTNQVGAMAFVAFFLPIILLCLWLSRYFATHANDRSFSRKHLIVLIYMVTVCVIFSAIFLHDLMQNGNVRRAAMAYLWEMGRIQASP